MWNIILEWIISWPGTAILVTTFIGIGAGAMSMSPPVCWITRICFTLAALLLLAKLGYLAIDKEPSIIKRIISVFIIFGVIGTGWVESMRWINNRELLLIYGILIPDNKPNPNILKLCTIPNNHFVLILGRYITYTNAFPFTIISLDDKPLVSINKTNDKLSVSGEFYSTDRRIVAQITNNKFTINPNNYFRIERPNFHRLIVYDQYNNLVLDIEFINNLVIKIIGDYYPPNANLAPLIINDQYIKFGKLRINGTIEGHISIRLRSDGLILVGDFSD